MDNKKNILHSNNFDCLRIFAALAVLYSHHFALSGKPEPYLLGINTIGGDAVYIFFTVSGYLVTSSWLNDPNFFRFSLRRILRIWPALTVVVLGTAYILGPILTTLPLNEYFSNPVTHKYIGWLWMQANFVLPGVLESNPYPGVLNGSLWTIPLEVQCYIVLTVAGILGLLRKKSIFLLAIFAYLIWFFIKSSPDLHGTIHSARQLGAYFLIGALLYIAKPYFTTRWIYIIPLVLIVGFLLFKSGYPHTANLLILPFLTIALGTQSTPVVSKFGRWGDPSYGIYLFAFPVQQTVIMSMMPEADFYGSMFVSAAITILLAYASWHLIEKQAIKFKPKRKSPPQNLTSL